MIAAWLNHPKVEHVVIQRHWDADGEERRLNTDHFPVCP